MIKEWLKILYNADEGACIANDAYGTSVEVRDLLQPGPDTVYCSINPLEPGTSRKNKNVMAYRTFLIEMDSGTIPSQLARVDRLGMPYSSAVFSGSKSVHFLICLEKPLATLDDWRLYFNSLSNIIETNDRSVGIPSGFTRMPYAEREGVTQTLLRVRGRVENRDLDKFLEKFPDKRPTSEPFIKKGKRTDSLGKISELKNYTRRFIMEGRSGSNIGRHHELKLAAIDMFENGFQRERAIDLLSYEYLRVNEDKDMNEIERLWSWIEETL